MIEGFSCIQETVHPMLCRLLTKYLMKDGRGGREPQLHAWSAQSRRPGVQPG